MELNYELIGLGRPSSDLFALMQLDREMMTFHFSDQRRQMDIAIVISYFWAILRVCRRLRVADEKVV